MGNLAPLGLLAHGTPEQVEEAAFGCLDRINDHAGLILSAGGMLHPDTPPENIDALVRVVRG